jgi:hypothetical protein
MFKPSRSKQWPGLRPELGYLVGEFGTASAAEPDLDLDLDLGRSRFMSVAL